MKRNIFIGLFILLLSSGCMSIAWRGYKKPMEADFVSLNSTNQCMRLGVQNLDKRQKQAVIEAAAIVCKIIESKEFEDSVVSKSWLLNCNYVDGNPDEMTGYEVLKIIRTSIRDYSIHPRKPWSASAQTQRNEIDIAYNRVAIKPSRIEDWHSIDKSVKSELLNTIAHETTHIISYRFRDRGHGSSGCPDERLVSYGLGNLVAKLWLKTE